MFFKQFGGKIKAEHLQRYQESPNWQNGQFQNLEQAEMNMSPSRIPYAMYKQFVATEGRIPKANLPIQPFHRTDFLADSNKGKFIWYGHSAILMRLVGKTILVDPMLGSDTTPIAPFSTKRFSTNTLDLIDDFPTIDLLLLTHDHYDHLDYASIQKLKDKTEQFVVALGVKRHLVSWGISENRILELDWWQEQSFDELKITFTPTQHFSGRGLTDRMKSFWGGFALQTPTEHIWVSGDGGYGSHFKTIGERLPAFDFAFMECGQYNVDWQPVHLFPGESVYAAQDANVRKAMPIHWAGFPLSYYHTWKEPADQFVKAAIANKLDYFLPRLGELFTIDEERKVLWWEALE
jgi:L-ascorbate metabolism protein UlaG (beta-lactamase superfamily)